MKKNIYLSVVAMLLAGTALTSCDDFLEAENKSAGGQTAEQRFTDDPDALLTSAYNTLKNYVYNTALNSEGTDLYIYTRGKAGGEFNEYTITPENTTVESYYSNVYNTINYANGVIKYGAEGTQPVYEARFLRNYGYYLLTQQFGGVPYITEYINSAETNYPRTPLSEIYPAMIADLTDLYNNSTLADQSHEGRASKQAVAALLAKVCLAAGWDLETTLTDALAGNYTVNGTSYFTQAASWAEAAINGIQLTMSFQDKWYPTNEGNAEEIFSVQYDRAGYPGDVSSGGHSMQNNFGGYYGNCTSSGLKNCSGVEAQSEKSMYLFEEGDLRYEATYMTTMYNAKSVNGVANWGTEGYYAYYTVSNKDKLPICGRYFPYYVSEEEAEAEFAANIERYKQGEYTNVPSAAILTLPNIIKYTFKADGTWTKSQVTMTAYHGATMNGVVVKKFDDIESAQVSGSNDYRDIVIFHVSDMYLVAAEAYFMAGQTSQALTKINAVRARAGLKALASFSDYEPQYYISATFAEKDIDLILDERARELYAEGQRWVDLRRTKQLVRYNVEFNQYVTSATQMANNSGEYKWYRPIPSDEFERNTGLTAADQNPGY